jgi:hypothetical protein
MKDSLLTRSDLAHVIDECLADLPNGGSKLYDLAYLLQTVGSATDNDAHQAAFSAIGSFGNEIVTFRPLVSFPVLPDDMRKTYKESFNKAIQDGTKALKILRKELCGNSEPDPAAVIKVIALLNKHDYALTAKRSAVTRPSRSSQPASAE